VPRNRSASLFYTRVRRITRWAQALKNS
jgi:hypothetical protein